MQAGKGSFGFSFWSSFWRNFVNMLVDSLWKASLYVKERWQALTRKAPSLQGSASCKHSSPGSELLGGGKSSVPGLPDMLPAVLPELSQGNRFQGTGTTLQAGRQTAHRTLRDPKFLGRI